MFDRFVAMLTSFWRVSSRTCTKVPLFWSCIRQRCQNIVCGIKSSPTYRLKIATQLVASRITLKQAPWERENISNHCLTRFHRFPACLLYLFIAIPFKASQLATSTHPKNFLPFFLPFYFFLLALPIVFILRTLFTIEDSLFPKCAAGTKKLQA